MPVLKKLPLIILLLLQLWIFDGDLSAKHVHSIIAPTCNTPGVCEICFHVVKPTKKHTISPASCTLPEYCVDCGKVFHFPRGHLYQKETCTEPMKCVYCGKYSGSPHSHTIIDATCTEPSYCLECNKIFSDPIGHDIIQATCTKASYCTRCNKQFDDALGHDIIKATCTEARKCRRCNMSFGKPLGHAVKKATCIDPEYCTRCNTVFSEAKGHIFNSLITSLPSCNKNGTRVYTCTECGYQYYESIPATGHTFVYSQNEAYCSICNYHKVILNVGMLYQGKDYPNGCESVSAVMALRYVGVDIDVETFIEDYLPKTSLPYYYVDRKVGENPESYFIGDPRLSSGYYCFAPVIEQAVNNLVDNNYYCSMQKGETLEELCKNFIDKGIPVIIWSTLWMNPIRYTEYSWQIIGTSQIHTLIKNLHCVLLVGYDDMYYYINDPLRGQVAYEKSIVNTSFISLGSQAVTVSKI